MPTDAQKVGNDGLPFPQTMDAKVWAQEFIEISKRIPFVPHDEGTMLGWFANAIMVGYDTGYSKGLRDQIKPNTKDQVRE